MPMDDLLNWTDIAGRLDGMGRGARSRLATVLGMDRSQLARMLRQTDYPKANQARVIEGFLQGRETESLEPREPEARTLANNVQRVPLFGYAAGSDGSRIAFNEGSVLDWVDLPRGMTLKGEFFVVQTLGHSMEPRIWAGERKLVQRGVPPARDQDAVIEFNDGSGVLKTYKRQRDGQIFAHQYNPDEELRFDATSVKALHAVFPL